MSIYKDKRKTKDGRQYCFKVMIDGVRYQSKYYMTREEARKAEAQYILKNKHPDKKPFVIVADSYFENLNTYCKYSTTYTYLKDYNKHILPYFKNYDVGNINTLAYNNWYDSMAKKGLSVKYLNKINSLFKNIMQYAVQNYGLEYNPVIKTFKESRAAIKGDKIRYITKDEFDKFISYATDPMYKLLFTFLFKTGARIGEVICLCWSDLDLDEKYVSITKTLYKIHDNKPTSNKTATNRKVYLDDSLVKELKEYKATKEQFKNFSNDWYVFGDIQTLSTTQIARKKHQYFLESGVHEITIHEFRHSHVSNMVDMYLKSGNTDSSKFFIMMSQRLGHTIPVMQRTYLHLFPNTQNEIVDLLNNLS